MKNSLMLGVSSLRLFDQLKTFSTVSLVVMSIFLSSCQPVVKLLYGIKKPKLKSEVQILKYTQDHNFADRDNYALSFKGYSSMFGSEVITIVFFDSEGNLLIPKRSLESSCSGLVSGYITELVDTSLFIATDSILFAEYLKGLSTLDGEEVKPSIDPKSEFHVVITWATFMGRLNRSIVEWETLLDSMSEHHQISVTRLNLDMQEFWENDPQYTDLLKPNDLKQ